MRHRRKKPETASADTRHVTPASIEHSSSISNPSWFALESRIMFDGAAVATEGAVTAEQLAQRQVDASSSSENVTMSDTTPDAAPTGEQQFTARDQALFDALAAADTSTARQEIIFVSSSIRDYQQLLDGISPSAEVILLDSTHDGVAQMAEVLATRTGIDAIHLISHGDAGVLYLGTGTLTAESMVGRYTNELATIRQALSAQADFLIYGCDFSQGADGQTAVARLADLTGADVAASIDTTGHANLGGDWVLETKVGTVDTESLDFPDWEATLVTGFTSFKAGSYVIDMGQAIQTVNNSLKPYGLVYDLVENKGVPVQWAINPNKTLYGVDFYAGGKAYKGGSFIIESDFITPTVLNTINSYKALYPGLTVDVVNSSFVAPVYQTITSFPRVVLDAATGSVAQAYFNAAGIPQHSNPAFPDPKQAAYIFGNPTNLSFCNDVYVLPHADPSKWSEAYKVALLNFVNNGGWLFSECHAVSDLERTDLASDADLFPDLNFLSYSPAGPSASPSLILWGSHSAGTVPYSYNANLASDPEMQFMNRIDAATQKGSEQIYIPSATGDWRPTTKVAVYDPDHSNNTPVSANPNRTDLQNVAAAMIYGRAFGDSTKGQVMYMGGHNLGGTAPANVAAQRAFFDFILHAGFDRAPHINSVSLPSTLAIGSSTTVTATVDAPTLITGFKWASTGGGTFTNQTISSDVATGLTTITARFTQTAPETVITLRVTSSCGKEASIEQRVVATPVPNGPPDAINNTYTAQRNTPLTVATGTGVLANDTDPNGDPLIVSAYQATSANGGTVSMNPDGSFVYQPATNFSGTDTFTYTITDGKGGTDTATLTMTVPSIPSVAVNDSGATSRTAQLTINLLANDTYPGTFNPSTISLSNDSWGGWNIGQAPVSNTAYVVSNNDGTITFSPNNDANGTYSFDYTLPGLLNATGGPVTATVSVNVQSANPVAFADVATTQVGSPVTIFVVANDFAAPDPTIDWSALQLRGGQPANGNVTTVNPAGSSANPLDRYFVYTPNPGFSGVDTFQYRVAEDGTNSNTVTVTVNVVNAVNAFDNAYSVQQNSAEATLNVLTDGTPDFNPAGGALTISSVGATSNGGVAYLNEARTAILYTPANGFSGTETFTYAITDGQGSVDTATVTMTVTPKPNTAPDAVNDNDHPIAYDTNFVVGDSVLVNDADPDRDTVIVTKFTKNAVDFTTPGFIVGTYGTLEWFANGDWFYTLNTSNPAVAGLPIGGALNDAFTYTINDRPSNLPSGLTDTATLTIPILRENKAPKGVDDVSTTPANVLLNGNVLTNDVDLDPEHVGNLTVAGVNGEAVAFGLPITLASGATLTINASGTYTYDGRTVFASMPAGVSLVDSFAYELVDPLGAMNSAVVKITINAVNDAPVAVADVNGTDVVTEAGVNPGNTAFPGDQTATGNMLANDSDVDQGDAMTVTTIGTFTGTYGTIVMAANGNWTYTLNNADPDTNALAQGATVVETFGYTIRDIVGATSSSTLAITITGTNDAPVLDLDADNSSTATSPDYTTTFIENGAAVSIGDGDVTIADADNTTIQSATMTLTNRPDGVLEGLTVNGVLPAGITASSYNTSTGVLTLTGSATRAAYQTAIAQIQYSNTSENPSSATRSVTIVVNDGASNSNVATTAITVVPVNDPPLAIDHLYNMNEDGAAITLTPLAGATDLDGTPTLLRINGTLLTGGAQTIPTAFGAIFVSAGGVITYLPNLNANSTETLSYVITDGTSTATANETINVAPVNDAPTVSLPATYSGTEDGIITLNNMTLGDVDAGTSSVRVTITVASGVLNMGSFSGVTIVSGNGTSSLVLDGERALIQSAITANNLLTYTPVADFNNTGGTVALSVTLNDQGNTGVGGSLSTTANSLISLTPVADGVADTLTTNEDTAITANVITGTNGASPDTFENAGHILTAVTQGLHGSVTFAADGTITYTPNGNYVGLDTFTYTVTSGGVTELATVTVNVASINDAPLGTNTTRTINEDTAYVVTTADFGFTDPSDTPANQLTSITVTSLPPAGEGVYRLNGTPVTVGQLIDATDIVAGLLVFTPAANVNGAGIGALGFTVHDNGGTANGGVDTDPSPNTLNFTITPVDDIVTLSNLTDGAVGSTDAQVRESDLATGSTPAGLGETTTGTFTMGPSTALTSFTVNGGPAMTTAQLAASGTTPITVVGTYGTLTINGYNAATGVASYSYVLTSAASQPGATIVNDSFGLVTTDVENQTATGTLAINILDDVPVANADADEVINFAGTSTSIAKGNIVTGIFTGVGSDDSNNADGVADQVGADTAVSPVVGVAAGTVGGPVSGNVGSGISAAGPNDYGTLTISADGNYTYVPNYGNTTVAGLSPGQTLSDTFTYSIQDSDGDVATTTITFTIVGVPAIVGLNDGAVIGTDGSALESDLNSGGTNAIGVGETVAGTFTLSSPTGVVTLRVGGNTFTADDLRTASFGTPITTANGVLTITGYTEDTPSTGPGPASGGTVSYSYTLTSAPHSVTPVTDDFAVSLVDGNSVDTASAGKLLKIAIVDDTPLAATDTATATEAGIVAGSNPTGTVFANDQIGADGVSTTPVGPVTGVVAGLGAVTSGTGVGTGVTGNYGSVTIDNFGGYTYTVDNGNATVNGLQAGETLTDIFTYQITDQDGDTATATLTVTINGANDAPVATDDGTIALPLPIVEDTITPLTLLGNDTDVDGDTLSIKSINGTNLTPGIAQTIAVLNGTVTVTAGGTINFTPVLNYDGPVSFDYVVQDGNGGEDTGTVNLIVTPVNDTPVVTSATLTVNEGQTVTLTPANFGISDPDDTSFTYTVSGVVGGYFQLSSAAGTPITTFISADLASGLVQFVDDGNEVAPAFSVMVNDGDVNSNTLAATITYTSVNDAPVDGDETASTNEDTPLVVTAASGLLANSSDVDGGVPTITGYEIEGITGTQAVGSDVTITGIGTLRINADGGYSFTPALNYNGPVPGITYTVSDGNGGTDTSTLTLSVTPVNDAPVNTLPATFATNEDTSLTLMGLAVTDVDAAAGPLTVTLSVDSGLLAATAGGGVTVTGSSTDTLTLTGTLTDLNTFLAGSAPIFTPAANATAAVTLTMATTDQGNTGVGGPLTDTDTATITINPVNDAPVNTLPATFATNEDTSLTLMGLAVTDVDAAAGPLTVTLSVDSGLLAATAGGGVTVTGSSTDTLTLTGTLTDLNTFLAGSAPIFTPAANATAAVTLTMATTDQGNTGVGGPLTDTDTATITINPVNDAPMGTDKTLTTNEDTLYTFTAEDFGFTDPVDNQTDSFQSVTITTLPTSGTLQLNSVDVVAGDVIPVANIPLLTYTPASDANGTGLASFTFQVTDNGGTANGGQDTDPTPNTITFDVMPVNDAPAGTDTTITTNEDTLYTFTAADFGFTDPADSPADSFQSVTITTLPTSGAVEWFDGTNWVAVTPSQMIVATAVSSGNLRYSPALDANGTGLTSFTFQVADNGGMANGGQDTDPTPNTITVDVMPVNDNPVDGDETASTNEDTPLVVTAASGLLTNSSDVDGGTPTITGYEIAGITGTQAVDSDVTITGVGTIRINADGSYSFTPALNYNGPVPDITYTVADGNGGIDTSTLTLTITPVNDVPTTTDDSATGAEDTPIVLALDDFGTFSDVESAVPSSVTITALPVAGSLEFFDGSSWGAVTANQVITAADITSGNLRFIPAADANGSPYTTIGFQLSDGVALTTTQTVTIIVTSVNDDIPDADETVSAAEDSGTSTGSVLTGTSSPDGPVTVASFSIAGQSGPFVLGTPYVISGVGSLTLNSDGTYSFTPTSNYNGPVPVITYVTTDGSGANDTSTLTISVTPVNDDFPDADETVSVAEDSGTSTGSVLTGTSSPDGPVTVASFSIAGEAGPFALGTPYTITGVGDLILNSDGSYSFTPVANYNGPVPVITYVTTDGSGANDTSTLTFSVTAVNDAPVTMVPPAQSIEEGVAQRVSGIRVTDIDGNLATVQLSVAHGTLTVTPVGTVTVSEGANGSASLVLSGSEADLNATLAGLVYRNTLGFQGLDTLTVRSMDSGGLTDVETVELQVGSSLPPILAMGGFTMSGASQAVRETTEWSGLWREEPMQIDLDRVSPWRTYPWLYDRVAQSKWTEIGVFYASTTINDPNGAWGYDMTSGVWGYPMDRGLLNGVSTNQMQSSVEELSSASHTQRSGLSGEVPARRITALPHDESKLGLLRPIHVETMRSPTPVTDRVMPQPVEAEDRHSTFAPTKPVIERLTAPPRVFTPPPTEPAEGETVPAEANEGDLVTVAKGVAVATTGAGVVAALKRWWWR